MEGAERHVPQRVPHRVTHGRTQTRAWLKTKYATGSTAPLDEEALFEEAQAHAPFEEEQAQAREVPMEAREKLLGAAFIKHLGGGWEISLLAHRCSCDFGSTMILPIHQLEIRFGFR